MANDSVPAEEYHERTKHTPQSVQSGHRLDFENKPTPYKRYTDLSREDLPDPDDLPVIETPTLEAITVDGRTPPPRVTDTEWEPPEIDSETLAQICFYAAGVTKEIELRDRVVEFRAASCTGNLHHLTSSSA